MKTVIVLKKETGDDLRKISKKGKTYDEVLKILILSWNESK